MGMNGEELTEQETALYDHQIRVWGADAQRSFARSCSCRSRQFDADRPVTEEALSANVLVALDENMFAGKFIAELCCDSLKDLLSCFSGKSLIKLLNANFNIPVLRSTIISHQIVLKCSDSEFIWSNYDILHEFLSWQEAIAVPWKSLPKRMSKLYFTMRVIERFEQAEGDILTNFDRRSSQGFETEEGSLRGTCNELLCDCNSWFTCGD
ncbi:SUMO-activating enzyme subunit 1A-like isoform X2 [Actinidia eriantha]|uniref:SUMO-activating enzyme subunit 1A-like isoform X2 n=1 Tax=Actinidia eriantha TaxID=165200 RepID=UPI00258E65D2|nr:SUMO-activating enzyme subunit 1A-like isoform X2 [Actinidia eriantha]